ncbi:MAG: hypothetical protein ABL897_14140, partial [Hyphomicrobium sp.]
MPALNPPEPQFIEPSNATQMNAAANNLPVVRWLMRAQWGVVILAVIMIFDGILLPLLGTRQTEPLIVAIPVMLLMLGGIGATFWMLGRARESAKQEILLREAFHSVMTPQLISDARGKAVLSNRAFIGWIDISNQNAEAALMTRFSENPATANEFRQLCQTARSGQVAVAELPVMRGGKVVEWRRITTRQLAGWPGYLQWRLEDVSER